MVIDAFVAALPKVELHLHLAGHGIALEVCPTSNVCTGAVPSLAGLARAGACAAFCPEPVRRAILAEIDQLIPAATKN